MSLVIDPRHAQGEVPNPVVAWEGEEPKAGQWAGTLITDEHPQVELRRPLTYGGDVVVRLSASAHIEREDKPTQPFGVMLSANRAGAIMFEWEEYYSLTFAVAEAGDKLVAEQERVLRDLGNKLKGGAA